MHGSDLTFADVSDADFKDADLRGVKFVRREDIPVITIGPTMSATIEHDAEFGAANGLTVEQLLRARFDHDTFLPDAIAKDQRVIRRLQEIKQRRR